MLPIKRNFVGNFQFSPFNFQFKKGFYCITLIILSFMTQNNASQKPKSAWGLVLKIIITVATAIVGALGISSCM